MPILPEHLSKLRCLKTGSTLKSAPAELLADLNVAIEVASLRDELGRVVNDLIRDGLVNEDQSVLYPIEDGAIQMVREELIPLEQLERDLKGTGDE